MPGIRYFKLVNVFSDSIRNSLEISFFAHQLRRPSSFFVITSLLASLAFILSPPFIIHADDPILFSENFDGFTGGGFNPDPAPGQLDSDHWIVTGLSDGDLSFGDVSSFEDFARGMSGGGVTTGGLYGFDVGGGNSVLGIQPGGSDFTPGEIVLRIQNDTGNVITQLDISYEVWHYNDQGRATSLKFAYSADGLTYIHVPTLDFFTPEAADAFGWQSSPRSATLTGLNFTMGDFLYLKWTGDDAGGSGSRDEYGLDNVVVSINDAPVVDATIPAAGASDVAVDANVTVTFNRPVILSGDWFNVSCDQSGFRAITDTVISGGPLLWTIDPNSDFASNEYCTATIFASQVVDQDNPSVQMVADHVFSFKTIAEPILISEFLYDGLTPSSEGDEFVELCNPNPNPVNLTDYKVGDQEIKSGGESMYFLPAVSLEEGGCLIITKDKVQFEARFGSLTNLLEVSSLKKYTAWGRGSLSLANTGDEILLLGPNDEILDSAAYRNGDYANLGLEPDATAPEPFSLQRVWPVDTNSMPHDFVRAEPNPGSLTRPPAPPAVPPPPAALPGGMNAYWGHLHAHTTYSDGAGPPFYALAMARAAGLHFYGISDHAWWLTQTEWEKTLPQVANATVPGQFVALRGQEWTHDTVGHINLYNTDILVQRTDPRFNALPKFYDWLAANPVVMAQFNHPDASYDGNFENFTYHAGAAPQLFLQEIGNHAQGYVTYEPAFVQSNAVGYHVAPTNNGDTHTANWGADTIGRTGLVAPALTETDLLDALRARRVFSTEDSNLALALRSNNSWMGSVLPTTGSIPLTVDFLDPDPEPLTLYLYDGNLLLAAVPNPTSTGQWTTMVEARPGHYFWAKIVQADGNIAYSAPIWIEGRLEPETIYINEIHPAPQDNWDWDGDGTADYHDEFIELYNPQDRPVGLGGWRLVDAAGTVYDIPLGVIIPAHGYATFHYAQTSIALNNGGDAVNLIHPNGMLVDSFSYDHSPGYDESWCRVNRWTLHARLEIV